VNDGKINWVNTIFFTLTSITGVAGVLWLVSTGAVQAETVGFSVILLYLSGLSITAGYHRYFSHLTYEASLPLRIFYLIFGTMGVQGSVLEWCTDHRNHHLYTDTNGDPYNAKRGFWYSHIGWLFLLDDNKRDYSNVRDLAKDPAISFQHVYYLPVMIILNFIMPLLVCSLWGDPWGGLLIAGFARMAINHHFTFFINSLAHILGKQTYSSTCTAKDNWILSFFTYGEGFHNYHHQFAKDYRNGVRWFHFDPTKWLIFLCSKLKLASNLLRIPETTIIGYQFSMQTKEAKAHCNDESLQKSLDEMLVSARETLNRLSEQMDEIRAEYIQLKNEKVSAMKKHVLKYQFKVNRLKQKQIKQQILNTIESYRLSVSMIMCQASS